MHGGQRNRYLRAMGFIPLMLRESGQESAGDVPVEARVAPESGQGEKAEGGSAVEAPSPVAGVDLVAEASPVESSQPGSTVETLQDSLDPLATVLVTWTDGDLELDPLHPGGGLLIKMLAALKVPLGGFRILRIADDSPAAAWIDRCVGERPVFCLADQRPESQAPDLVMLPSLQRILREQAPAKRAAWSALQPWVGRLGATDPS